MKSLTVLFLILVTLFTTQAFAEDATPQPLTRADCETAPGWSWSETANICEGGAKDVAALKPQPLTRSDCEQAGMSWNDTALVCDDASARKATADINANPVGSSILITIDKSTQKMTVLVDGVQKYDWPVSTGQARLLHAVGHVHRHVDERDLVQQGMGQRSHAACGFLHEGRPRDPWQL